MATFKDYYHLIKPGIIRGNALSTIAGFFLASASVSFNGALLAYTLLGISLVIASGCVFNNVLDTDIDKKMARTKKRGTATGAISEHSALPYGLLLGLAGMSILSYYVNTLTALVALTGFIFYVIVYGIAKRKTVHGTLVGSISGAIPPVVGYTAVSNRLDIGALLLFIILVAWQMPHFYAIAIFRLKDYSAANIPVLPAIKGVRVTKIQILAYIILFGLASFALTLFGYTGVLYAIIMALLTGVWFGIGVRSYTSLPDVKWARQMFGLSLLVLLGWCLAIVVDSTLV